MLDCHISSSLRLNPGFIENHIKRAMEIAVFPSLIMPSFNGSHFLVPSTSFAEEIGTSTKSSKSAIMFGTAFFKFITGMKVSSN